VFKTLSVLPLRYDTKEEFNVTQKLSDQLNLAHVDKTLPMRQLGIAVNAVFFVKQHRLLINTILIHLLMAGTPSDYYVEPSRSSDGLGIEKCCLCV